MAGFRVKVLLVLLSGTLLLSGALGWERIQANQLRSLYATGQAGGGNADDDDMAYDDYEAEDHNVEDATGGYFDPLPEHGINVKTDSSPTDWSPVEDEVQVEMDSGPSDWSRLDEVQVETPSASDWASIDQDSFQVETVVGPRDWSSVPDGFQVDMDAGTDDWTSGSDESQMETIAETDDWSSKNEDEFQGETDSGAGDWSSDPDAGFQVESGKSDLSDNDYYDEDLPVEVVSGPRGSAGATDEDLEFIDSPPTSWPGLTSPGASWLDVDCSEAGFHITLSAGSLRAVKVLGSKDFPVMGAPKNCSYDVNPIQGSFTVPFTGCNVKQQTGGYSLQLLYNNLGRMKTVTVSCEINSGLVPRLSHTIAPKCPKKVPTKPKNCNIPSGERIRCGHKGISASDCKKKGCCSAYSACFYPLDECTADKYFIFAIRHDSASSLDPTKLVIPRHPGCKPIIVNSKVAIYKFKVTECGARSYVVGKTQIYLAEVQTVIKALNLKYGIITRDQPLRFLIECRYGQSGSSGGAALSSVGYMVKMPTSADSVWPSSVTSHGLYGVQLRLATDKTYSSYLPTYHQPLRLLLGKPIYLELNLKSPKPDAVLLVNYCLAYPRNARNALVLIYQGCPNPHDKSVAVLYVRDPPNNRHQRRFMVRAFQFMDIKTKAFLNEEIYFMCSTEVCRTLEKKCVQRCFDMNKS